MSGRGTLVVTGAGRGIGAAIAERCGADGWSVWCVDVQRELAESTAWSVRDAGGSGRAVECDVGDPASVSALWAALAESGDRITGLVNNAAIFPRRSAVEIDDTEWQRVLAVNLTGAFLMCRAFARQTDRSGGAIVNVASGQAFRPIPLGAHYAASKAALVNLGRSLAVEWGTLRIRVNTLVPGLVASDQSRAAMDDAQLAEQAALNPLGRLALPADVAGGAALLLSADAGFVNGQVLVVDGGVLRL